MGQPVECSQVFLFCLATLNCALAVIETVLASLCDERQMDRLDFKANQITLARKRPENAIHP
jgi:hypothetical protein